MGCSPCSWGSKASPSSGCVASSSGPQAHLRRVFTEAEIAYPSGRARGWRRGVATVNEVRHPWDGPIPYRFAAIAVDRVGARGFRLNHRALQVAQQRGHRPHRRLDAALRRVRNRQGYRRLFPEGTPSCNFLGRELAIHARVRWTSVKTADYLLRMGGPGGFLVAEASASFRFRDCGSVDFAESSQRRPSCSSSRRSSG